MENSIFYPNLMPIQVYNLTDEQKSTYCAAWYFYDIDLLHFSFSFLKQIILPRTGSYANGECQVDLFI